MNVIILGRLMKRLLCFSWMYTTMKGNWVYDGAKTAR